MMFCTRCGNDLTEGDRFCKACGNPVAEAAAPPGPPPAAPAPAPATMPGVPPAPYGYAPPAKKSNKTLVAVLLGLLGLAVVAGVVLVLVLVVFKGGGSGPEDVAKKCLEAYGIGDYGEMAPYLDESYFSGNKLLKQAFEEGLERRIPAGGITFYDLTFTTTQSGETATLKLVKGKGKYKQDSKVIVFDVEEEGTDVELKLVKKDGEWLVLPSSFYETIAIGLVSLGDAVVSKLESADRELDDYFNDLSQFVYSDPPPSGAQIEQELSKVAQKVSSFTEVTAEAQAYYSALLELEGERLQPYQAYAEAMISLLDAYAALNELEIEAYGFIADSYAARDAGQPVDMDAFNAAIDQFNARKDQLIEAMEEQEYEVYELQMKLELYQMGASGDD